MADKAPNRFFQTPPGVGSAVLYSVKNTRRVLRSGFPPFLPYNTTYEKACHVMQLES